MDRKQKIIELARQMGLIRSRDVEAVGIHREYLLRLYREGTLRRVGRGLYALPGALTSEFLSLAEVVKRVPNAVICLISALQFHNLAYHLADNMPANPELTVALRKLLEAKDAAVRSRIWKAPSE